MAVSLKLVKCGHDHYGLYDCPECIRHAANLMEYTRDMDAKALVAIEATPATDQEWEEHLASCGHGEPVEVVHV